VPLALEVLLVRACEKYKEVLEILAVPKIPLMTSLKVSQKLLDIV
jgi:hypothetical protein